MDTEIARLYKNCPPPTLFHYTSNSAALEIIESHSLWATEIRYLSDSSELFNALRLIGWAALDRVQGLSGDESILLRDFYRWCESVRTTDRCTFVISLTEHGNLLSQWRAYGGTDGQGVSLEFDAQALKALSSKQGFQLGRCIYDEGEQKGLARCVVDHLLAEYPGFDWVRNKPASHESVRFYPLFDNLMPKILSLSALMKHSAFIEEAEWRLVSNVVPEALVQGMRFRSGRSCIVPYLSMDLIEADDSLKVVTGANIGPSSNPNLAMASLRMLFDRCIPMGSVLRNLQIPLRPSV